MFAIINGNRQNDQQIGYFCGEEVDEDRKDEPRAPSEFVGNELKHFISVHLKVGEIDI